MKDNKKIRIIGEDYGYKVPEGEYHMECIAKINSALRAWTDLSDERGYILITIAESNEGTAVLNGRVVVKATSSCDVEGNNERLSYVLNLVLHHSEKIRELLRLAAKIDGVDFNKNKKGGMSDEEK